MADQTKDRLIEHSYDGIQEYDNPMPRWWVLTFWATIIFSVVYALNIFGIGVGKGRIADYEQDMAAFRAAHPAPSRRGGRLDRPGHRGREHTRPRLHRPCGGRRGGLPSAGPEVPARCGERSDRHGDHLRSLRVQPAQGAR